MSASPQRLPNDDVGAVGERLRELRLAFGFHERPAWGRFLGIKQTAVLGYYEDGLCLISVNAALRYCARTGVDLDWIYRGLDDGLPMHVKQKLDDYRVSTDRPNPLLRLGST